MLAARRLRHGPPCFPGGPSPPGTPHVRRLPFVRLCCSEASPEPPTYDGCRSCACAAPRPPRNPPRTTVAVRALVLLGGLPGTPTSGAGRWRVSSCCLG